MAEEDREMFEKLVGPLLGYPFSIPLQVIISPDYYLGLKKFDELRDIHSSARLLLWDAYKPNDEYEKTGATQPEGILWMKTVYWKSAIIWLNHCEDYVLQAISLALGLHNSPKDNRQWYKAILKGQTYQRVENALKAKNSTLLIPLIEQYHKDSATIRNWANTLKHRELIEVKEFNDLLNTGIMDFNIIKKEHKISQGEFPSPPPDDAIIYGRKDVIPQVITFEEGLQETFSVFQKLNAYILAVRVGVFGEDKFFAFNENGATIGANPQVEF